ncbi:proline--tRNA ligase [Acidithiobacillus ferridurans]|uniref:proline--tRNA ligase n=1 Tax=Acidithiobacillus ferridurans TaxID=1232575 RepID=UPI001C067F34|nr:proline--tRNA ligase [Acidithiobacillus ferridurans]MBU2732423.1 proline--tRNA ligase [Acidithiobacillus ferridurans]
MRASQIFIPTLKETPAEAELVSHQLLLRGGFIRRLASGLYTWMPLGLRVLRKVERVVREEMDRSGAQELLMPVVQPAELWQESGRWEQYGPELLRLRDRHDREFCLGPTHEEVISDLARREIHSYRQLPVNFYQIQTKFRDEIRPRFGLMRGREFIMKDAYSFHMDHTSLEITYQAMYEAYQRIFTRLGLNFRAVEADNGAIGGKRSHEFHVLADSGEDAIVSCHHCDYAANMEKAASRPELAETEMPLAAERVRTPGIRTVAEQAEHLGIPTAKIVKTVLVVADGKTLMMLLRGDDELNLVKAGHALNAQDVQMASPEEAVSATGAPLGFIGPKEPLLSVPILADHRALGVANFSTGANAADMHWINLNWDRDLPRPAAADLRNVRAGDACPHCAEGTLSVRRGIEVGHVFQLGERYSKSMGITVLDETGRDATVTMGCYGIGVSRVVAAAVEQHFDERGITWPVAIAPFEVGIVAINARKSPDVTAAAQALHDRLEAEGYSVLLDDRDERPGVQFATMDLIGLPHRIVVSDAVLAQGVWEYRARRTTENVLLDETQLMERLRKEHARG